MPYVSCGTPPKLGGFPVVKLFQSGYPFFYINRQAGSIRSAEFSSGPRKIISGWPSRSTDPSTFNIMSLIASTYYMKAWTLK